MVREVCFRVVRVHRNSIKSWQAMRRILSFFSHHSSLAVLAFAVMLQASAAQNAAPSRNAPKPDAGSEQNPTVTAPSPKSSESRSAQTTDTAALTLGPGDEVE